MQTIEELNARFGAPGRIVFHQGLGGYPEAVISNRYGAAEIALCGANVKSYRPTGHSPVLFFPKFDEYARGKEVHGGMPLCWPWFGKSGEPGSKSHGFARACVFEVRATNYTEEITEITLGLKSDENTKSLWNYDFDLEYKISVSMKLNLTLTTTNTGDREFVLTEGFHPYFKVMDRNRCEVRGVAGHSFIDARDMSNQVFTSEFVTNTEADHVVTLPEEPKHEFVLMDNGMKRAIGIVSTGNKKLVIWNPGPGVSLYDLQPDDWQHFLCVEPATLWRDDGFILPPGQKHTLEAAFQSNLPQ